MSNFYNMMFGRNSNYIKILKILDLTEEDFERFRDIFVDKDKGVISVYTRLGGGNRDDYQHVFEKMGKHPDFIIDFDDSIDTTYCTFVFKVDQKKLEETLKEEEK